MLSRRSRVLVTATTIGLVVAGTAAATAGDDDRSRWRSAALSGLAEDPAAISSTGTGTFRARVDGDAVVWSLAYRDLEGAVQQAHIHLGNHSQSGGISVFLCSNLGNGPAGTPACPASGTVGGTIEADDVIGPAAQGIAPGELDELLSAVRAGAAYVNVHSTLYPGGEIRTQIGQRGHEH